jgi:ribonuclease HI
LLCGLQHAVKLRIQELYVSGDSQIVLTQVTGWMDCNSPHLQVLLNEVKQLENKISTVHYMHFIRSFNGSADLFASEALKSKVSRVIDDKPVGSIK